MPYNKHINLASSRHTGSKYSPVRPLCSVIIIVYEYINMMQVYFFDWYLANHLKVNQSVHKKAPLTSMVYTTIILFQTKRTWNESNELSYVKI